jgi:hypothetical protein
MLARQPSKFLFPVGADHVSANSLESDRVFYWVNFRYVFSRRQTI